MAIGNAAATQEISRSLAKPPSPGWHWVTKFANMRTLGEKPLAPIIVSMDTARAIGIAPARISGSKRNSRFIRNNHHRRAPYRAIPKRTFWSPLQMVLPSPTGYACNCANDSVIWVLGALPLGALLVAVLGNAAATQQNYVAVSLVFYEALPGNNADIWYYANTLY